MFFCTSKDMIHGCVAYDLIVTWTGNAKWNTEVTHGNNLPTISSSECIFRFGTKYSSSDTNSIAHQQQSLTVYLVVHSRRTGDTLRFPISSCNTIQQDTVTVDNFQQQRQHDPIALQQLLDALSTLNSETQSCGPHKANYILVSDVDSVNDSNVKKEKILGIAPFHIHVYKCNETNLAIVDVDGTITTSTLSGFWNTAVHNDYSTRHCHDNVCQFFSNVVTAPSAGTSNNNDNPNKKSIQLVYLTNRPITYVAETRNLLTALLDDQYSLPKGPLIGFTGNLSGVFKVRITG
jgi:LNS2 (Lipin/Ned1/Smp2)